MRNAMLAVVSVCGFAGPAAAQDGVPGKTKAQAEAAKAAAATAAGVLTADWQTAAPATAAAAAATTNARLRYKNYPAAWTDPADSALIGTLLDGADAFGVDAGGWMTSGDAFASVGGSYENAGNYWLSVSDWDTAYTAFTTAADYYALASGAYQEATSAAVSQSAATGAAWTIMDFYQPPPS
jgi:hypothetical protein